ncbi:MAG: nucleoid-associated protein [Bacteroidota bacterium]|nr:nucleoid-associated protein [Bacteroidota bacterium]MDP3145873.1 nucleoid-associated protein [Bacteroidota bacterium]MDP3558507.1 nucleoid-associated protein [Bacteroidota bacterium]
MIDFSRAALTHFCVHFVGNKGLGEELTLSDKTFEFKDDFVKETVLRYFLSPFKTDIYYQFKGKVDVSLASVANACEDLFSSRKEFVEQSKQIATHLYNQSMHPKIKGGEFYVCFFKDAMVDGELTDAIGFFKTENKETYLKVYQHVDEFDIDCDNGININKLDKGCLVFEIDKNKGYKLSIIDTNNRNAECALYWEEDFLNAVIKPNGYYHTKNFIDTSRGFCEEILTEANNVNKQDQMMMLNRSTSYFKEKDKFDLKDFEKEVLVEPELIGAFKEYRKDFTKKMDLTAIDEFDVSQTAVKKNQKYMRSVVKLDKNFHIYIHARHDYVERGFDEEKGLKYYKLFYINEEQG